MIGWGERRTVLGGFHTASREALHVAWPEGSGRRRGCMEAGNARRAAAEGDDGVGGGGGGGGLDESGNGWPSCEASCYRCPQQLLLDDEDAAAVADSRQTTRHHGIGAVAFVAVAAGTYHRGGADHRCRRHWHDGGGSIARRRCGCGHAATSQQACGCSWWSCCGNSTARVRPPSAQSPR